MLLVFATDPGKLLYPFDHSYAVAPPAGAEPGEGDSSLSRRQAVGGGAGRRVLGPRAGTKRAGNASIQDGEAASSRLEEQRNRQRFVFLEKNQASKRGLTSLPKLFVKEQFSPWTAAFL